MNHSSVFAALHEQLQWPAPDEIFNPPGAGPAVYAQLVRQKLEKPLQRLADGNGTRVGVLMGDPKLDDTDPPIAIVCDFPKLVSNRTLREIHRLAWNFCRSPLLVTLEPHLIRAWSCYEKPDLNENTFSLEPIEKTTFEDSLIFDHLVESLHWIQLASGCFLSRHEDRFPCDGRADKTLLENLKFVRRRLTSELPEEVVHDLLARLIFIQFLFQRKDSRGKPALNKTVLRNLYEEGILSAHYSRLPEILQNKTDTYALFQWLDERFNGDLFPDDWEQEKKLVKDPHLTMLADFVNGEMEMEAGQRCLWPLYSFDTIPLEFISSIYEEFVKNPKGTGIGQCYTPIHWVDFVLDKVLPWSGNEYDLKVLDPACGSAVFLVKVFQRLVHRWRTTHPGKEPPASFLRSLLERCLFGIDVEPRAIRVASFSLYLAMCDEIDPRQYWTRVRFPELRGITLRATDFFSEDVPGIRTKEDKGQYDLIVGNAPWGADSLSDPAREWARKHDWKTSNEQIGTLFLPKSAALAKESGRICMIQPAGALLFNRSPTALDFRRKLFETFKFEEVVNFSALRFVSFLKATGPTCLATLRPTAPDGEPLAYWCPKQTHSSEDQRRIVIDSHDLNWVYPKEAAQDPRIWSALTWGGRRDLELVRRLRDTYTTLGSAKKRGEWRSHGGFQRGKDKAREVLARVGLRILADHRLWDNCPVVANISRFPKNTNPMFERERKDIEYYRLPILVLKESWTVSKGRFRGVVIKPDQNDNYLLFSQSFYGVGTADERCLAAFAVGVNSALSVHYFFHTSGRLSVYRPTLRGNVLEGMPLPPPDNITLEQLARMNEHEIDAKAFELYNLNDVERTLVEDFFQITLQDFKGGVNSPGRQPVYRDNRPESASELYDYCTYFIDVLQAGFGEDKPICATILLPQGTTPFPFCLVAMHLEWPKRDPIVVETIGRGSLLERLKVLNETWVAQRPEWGNIFYQRVVRIYQTIDFPNGTGNVSQVPTVFMIKPNQRRYWTRAMALRDADEVAADIFLWDQAMTDG